jgi:ribonuclease VapC
LIAVDTSALIAAIGDEDLGERCAQVLASNELIISAATVTECLIVGTRPQYQGRVGPLLDRLQPEVVVVSEPFARLAADAYRRWGKGFHPARLNYGDSFSYALAELYDCPLLYVGDDFAQTDVRSALG